MPHSFPTRRSSDLIEDVARWPGRHVADLPFHDRGAAPAADRPADRAECCEEPAEQFASGYHDGRPRRGSSSGGLVVPRPTWLARLASGSPSGRRMMRPCDIEMRWMAKSPVGRVRNGWRRASSALTAIDATTVVMLITGRAEERGG